MGSVADPILEFWVYSRLAMFLQIGCSQLTRSCSPALLSIIPIRSSGSVGILASSSSTSLVRLWMSLKYCSGSLARQSSKLDSLPSAYRFLARSSARFGSQIMALKENRALYLVARLRTIIRSSSPNIMPSSTTDQPRPMMSSTTARTIDRMLSP